MLPAAAAALVTGGGPGGCGALFGCLGLERGGSWKVVLGVTRGRHFRMPIGILSATPG